MENTDTGLMVPKWVLTVWPKIPQMLQNLSAQLVRPNVLDFNEKRLHWVWKGACVTGALSTSPVPTALVKSKSGIDRFSRIFGKVFSRGNFWVLCIFACKKIRPGENFSCNKAISKPDVWAFEETFWSRHSKLQPNWCIPSTVNT